MTHETSDDDIVQLPVRHKGGDKEREFTNRRVPSLTFVKDVGKPGKCSHQGVIVDMSMSEVTCRDCGEKLNPIWVLDRLASKEGWWIRNRERYHDEMKRLKKRLRTKCNHCGEMTRISRR